jgi:hypothetical protein
VRPGQLPHPPPFARGPPQQGRCRESTRVWGARPSAWRDRAVQRDGRSPRS